MEREVTQLSTISLDSRTFFSTSYLSTRVTEKIDRYTELQGALVTLQGKGCMGRGAAERKESQQIVEKQSQWYYGRPWIQINSLPFQLHAKKQTKIPLLLRPFKFFFHSQLKES